MDDIEIADLPVGRTVYILQSRNASSSTWFNEGWSHFEDDMDALFNENDDLNGHDTYHQIIEVTVKRRA